MDILKIQYPIGTVVVDVETNERLMIVNYSGNKVYFESVFSDGPNSHDYFTLLGTMYVKDKTAQVLFGHKRDR